MKVLLGLTGSVAGVLAGKIAKALLAEGHEVIAVATPTAHYFLTDCSIVDTRGKMHLTDPDGIRLCEVYTQQMEYPGGYYNKNNDIPHIELGLWADAFLIAPASANTISDIAHGRADNILTAAVLAWQNKGMCGGAYFSEGVPTITPLTRTLRSASLKPLIISPAMNSVMLLNPIVKRNLILIQEAYLCDVLPTQSKKLACGVVGDGALCDIDEIVRYTNEMLKNYEIYKPRAVAP